MTYEIGNGDFVALMTYRETLDAGYAYQISEGDTVNGKRRKVITGMYNALDDDGLRELRAELNGREHKVRGYWYRVEKIPADTSSLIVVEDDGFETWTRGGVVINDKDANAILRQDELERA